MSGYVEEKMVYGFEDNGMGVFCFEAEVIEDESSDISISFDEEMGSIVQTWSVNN